MVLASVLPSVEREGNLLRTLWDRLQGVPGGRLLFHQALRVMVPYTGSLGARVRELRAGFVEVELRERFAVRNHLSSVHAIALANLCELCGNLGVFYAMPDDARFIITGIRMEYRKKARGLLVATSRPPVPTSSAKADFEVVVEVRDASGDVVCVGYLDTRVGPKKG